MQTVSKGGRTAIGTRRSNPGASTADPFNRLADRYDAWYEGRAGRVLFPAEVACLEPLLEETTEPRLEVGVGSGRFASALGIGFGIDPALTPLRIASERGVASVAGVGECLPFRDHSFGAVLVVVTICFAHDPNRLLAESCRVLAPNGALVLGMVFADSPWGEWYADQAERGHPFYSQAHFYSRAEVGGMLEAAGLQQVAARSTLVQAPSDEPVPEDARDDDDPSAGFVCWKAVPRPA